jgi:hypothetical protein
MLSGWFVNMEKKFVEGKEKGESKSNKTAKGKFEWIVKKVETQHFGSIDKIATTLVTNFEVFP